MKKFLTICLFLFAATTVFADGTVIKNSRSGYAGIETKTLADLTLYVRTGGSDTNDCLTSGAACLTFQEAVDRVPKTIAHNVLIDIGAGDFAGAYFEGFRVLGERFTVTSFKVTGASAGVATIASGNTSGTNDGGGVGYIDDSGGGWTVDDLIGLYLAREGLGGTLKVIDNTATRITFASTIDLSAAKTYELRSYLTRLVSPSADSRSDGYHLLEFVNTNAAYNEDIQEGSFYILQLYLDCDSTSYGGINILDANSLWFKNLQIVDTYSAVTARKVTGTIAFRTVFVSKGDGTGFAYERSPGKLKITGSTIAGEMYECVLARDSGYVHIGSSWIEGYTGGSNSTIIAERVGALYIGGGEIIKSGEDGIRASDVGSVIIDSAFIDSNIGYGVKIDVRNDNYKDHHTSDLVFMGFSDTTISNNGSGGVLAIYGTRVIIKNTLAGTGNTGYGVELQTGATSIIENIPTITGSSGEATINGGSTVLDWSTDFNDDGDIVVNLDNGCRIERRD